MLLSRSKKAMYIDLNNLFVGIVSCKIDDLVLPPPTEIELKDYEVSLVFNLLNNKYDFDFKKLKDNSVFKEASIYLVSSGFFDYYEFKCNIMPGISIYDDRVVVSFSHWEINKVTEEEAQIYRNKL
jgi:hypothetical protein